MDGPNPSVPKDLTNPNPQGDQLWRANDFDLRAYVFVEYTVGISIYASRELSDRGSKQTPGTRWKNWVNPILVRKIANLPCEPAVRDMLLDGFPATEIAHQIKGWGFCTDIGFAYLRNCIDHYRNAIPRSEIVQRMSPRLVIRAAKAIDAGLNELDELSDLYLKIKSRIDFGLSKERELNALIPGMEKMFQPALEALKFRMEIKGRMGVYGSKSVDEVEKRDRAREVDWDKVYNRPGMSEVMQDPKSRFKIMKFLESVNGICSKITDEEKEKILERGLRRLREGRPVVEGESSVGDPEDVRVVQAEVDVVSADRRVVREEPLDESGSA